MTFMGLSQSQHKQLEFEVVPMKAKLQLTRLLRAAVASDDHDVHVVRITTVVNIARNVLGLPILIIEADDWGHYVYVDYGYIKADFEVMLRRPDPPELVETLADLLQAGWVDEDEVNDIMAENHCGIEYSRMLDDDRTVQVLIAAPEEIAMGPEDEHPNIRALVTRMERSLKDEDFPGVLHASASAFETLAKDIVPLAGVKNQTLASFFERYRKDSGLPESVLDYILDIYKQRNVEPLAGHGQLATSTITKEQAITLCEMTKAFRDCFTTLL